MTQNTVGVLVKHPVPLIIIMDNHRYQIIKLHLIMEVNSILII